MNATRRIPGLIVPYRGRVALAVALTALSSLLSLPVPLLIQGLVDRVAPAGNPSAVPWYVLGLLSVFMAL